MRIIAISDTHGLHEALNLPKGDLIIHAGDISDHGTKEEVIDFLKWFANLDYTHKLFIGGNHDIFLDEYPVDLLELLPANVTYLNNNGTTINNLKFWGSPITPDLEGWAFGCNRKDMAAHWQYLPKDIDILITHTPPLGILDKSRSHRSLGCKDLMDKVIELKPNFHIFGHVHASYGQVTITPTTFINASNISSLRGIVNPPIIFDL